MIAVDCTYERHAGAILAIFNHAILTSTALYDYQARTDASMQAWFDAKRKGNYPVVGFEDENGVLMGFASYGPFRPFPAFKYSVEHSVYVDQRFRGQGLGEALLRAIVERARQQDYHVVVGAIDASNTVSCALHEKLGFKRAGEIPQAGFKFGRWLDLVFYQLRLETPGQPVDG
ncbi:GNAT family N-acetyltransferase [Bordetella sp. N]|uniref:GNAT family N-acetyltransferase n=1 Tax=Bordetella sp. N TaxID=1746199 RepID=UPI000709A7CB|nr:GNAT family N-acetyltransferase [Bordetella sp. N]ALM86515.1 acetyltransferase [Bordetella sp. N]